jgi:hypothetical protein
MKKLSTKILFIGLVVLVIFFVASRFFWSPRLESNLRKNLLKLDTASINEVRIHPAKAPLEEIKLIRDGKKWKVVKGTESKSPNMTAVKNLLGALVDLPTQRLVSRKKERWEDYQVGKNSTQVNVYSGGKNVADFHVGKLGFSQGGAGMFSSAYTYFRLSDEKEVYTVEGFLESKFNNSFDDWRDKTLLKLKKEEIAKISFLYPADSGFVLSRRDSVWFVDNEKADPTKAANFINQISSKYIMAFADGFTPSSQPHATLQINGKTGNLATVEGWLKGDGSWVLTSSFQKGIYFSTQGSKIASDIFTSRKKLLPDEK